MTDSWRVNCSDCYLGIARIHKKAAIKLAEQHIKDKNHCYVMIMPMFASPNAMKVCVCRDESQRMSVIDAMQKYYGHNTNLIFRVVS